MARAAERAQTKAMYSAPSPWTEERVEILRRCAADGMSTRQIVEVIGAGVTRNAIVGKAARLGIKLMGGASNSTPAKPKTATVRKTPRAGNQGGPTARIAKARRIADEGATLRDAWAAVNTADPLGQRVLEREIWHDPLPGSAPVSLMGLAPGCCKWPIGDRPTLFCGHEAMTGKPYCEAHYARSVQPARKEAAA